MELLKEMELPQYGVQLRRGKSVDSKENAAKAPPSCLSSSQRGDAVTTSSSSSGASAGASAVA